MEPLQPFPQPEPTIWEQNPKLKVLLLILIAVFLLSGIGLVIFQQWSNNYRQKVYEETQAGLPAHQVKSATTTPQSESDITNGQTYANNKYGFSIKYPSDWKVEDVPFQGTTTVFYSSNDMEPLQAFNKSVDEYNPSSISIQVWSNPNNSDVLTYLKSRGLDSSNFSKVNINNLVGYKHGAWGLSGGTVYIEIKNNIVVISEICCDTSIDGIFQKMWPTFNLTTTATDTSTWKTYKNDEYGFEFQVPEKFNVVDNKFVYDPNKANWPSVAVQVVKFNTVVTQDPQGKEDFLKLKQAISSQDKSQVTKLVPNHGIDVNFQNNGALLIYSETQAADYAVEYEIFDNNDNLITIRAEDGYNADLNQSFDSIKQSEAYKNLLQIAQSFKFTK